jgi:hypothetical protein
MKKRIEIEFDGADRDGLTDVQVLELNKILTRAIHQIHEFSNPKKVTVDGNVFWLRGGAPEQKVAKKTYPVHHEEHIVMQRPTFKKR